MPRQPKVQRDDLPPKQDVHLRAVGQADAADAVMQVVQLATSYWLSRCLQAVAEIGVADVLTEEPHSAADLARAVGANPDSLDRVLRLLSSQGIFAFRNGRYSHTPLSRALRDDHPHSLRSYVRFVGSPLFWDSYAEMEHVIRTGETGVSKIEPRGVFAYMNDHPELMEMFNGAMRGKAESAIGPVLAAYDFSVFGSVADVGGGLGHLLKAILKTAPNTQGVLFDQPHVIAQVSPTERLELRSGDFFRGPLPQCDCYILMEVLHDWTDDQCIDILRQVRAASANDAKLLVVETVLPQDNRPHFAHHLDINMMVLTGGRERTPDQLSRLFSDSGFRLSRVIPTRGAYSIVEANTGR
jgi:predicted transcriptional regulator